MSTDRDIGPTEANPIRTLFLAALEKTPAERQAFMDEACAGDARLRRRIEAMLRAHDAPSHLLDQSAADHLVGEDKRELLDLLEPATKEGTLGRLGHYEIQEVVGRGGMGIVLKAFDEKLHRVVAIKLLAPALAGSTVARQRFVREARAAAAVNHDNVIGIHAVEDGGKVPYLVMQFVGARTLQEKLECTGPLPLAETLRIGLQLAEGLAAAHRQGIIHRDVKPANILLENGVERVRITDFGLARAADDASMSQSGHVAGTPSYMSPEQASGEPLDFRSDLFSLGSVLYALCAGRPPFRGDGALSVLRRVCDDAPQPLREINPKLPAWMEAVIAKLLAKKPADRFASATEVAAVLSDCLAQVQSGSEPDLSLLKPVLSDVPSGKKRTEKKRTILVNRRWLLWLSLPVILVGCAWAAWDLTRTPPADPMSPSGDATSPSGTATAPPVTTPPSVAQPAPPPSGPVVLNPAHTFWRHSDEVFAVAFSPDGKVLATGGRDRTIILWNAETWQPRATLTGHSGDVVGLVFSPNGSRLASVSSAADVCSVRLWDVAAGKPAGTLGGQSQGVWSVDWSRDGARVACGGYDKTVTVWDVASGEVQMAVPNAFSRFARVLSFSPNGELLACGGMDLNDDPHKGRMRVWHVPGGKEVAADFPIELYPTFLPGDGAVVAGWTYEHGRVTVCEAVSGRVRAAWRAHPGRIEGLAVSSDGRCLASGGEEGLGYIWLTADQTEVARLTGHRGQVYALAFAPDGSRLATVSTDGSVRIWDLPAICRVRK